jgi:hypothetical protein
MMEEAQSDAIVFPDRMMHCGVIVFRTQSLVEAKPPLFQRRGN